VSRPVFVVRERLLERGPGGTDVGSHHRLCPSGVLGLAKPIAAVVAVLGVIGWLPVAPTGTASVVAEDLVYTFARVGVGTGRRNA